MTNEDKVKRWLAGELSYADRKQFESTEDFAKINRLLKAVNNFKAPEYNLDREYSKLYRKLNYPQRPIPLFRRIAPLVRVAAVLAIALTISFFFYDHFKADTTHQGWIAEQTEVYLPDSSFVSLNDGAQIQFSEKKWRKERNVELKGEAFFRVKKGSQFNVKTQQGIVSVLGTQFSVKDWDRFYEVTCYSGLVKVLTEQNSVILKPNSAYRIVNGKAENYTISHQTEPDWLNGESRFQSIPLRFVFNELERQYNVTIEARSVDLDQLFTGSFSHDNLEIALEAVTIPVNLDYKMNGNKIAITLEGK
ncbi:MAG: FecR family protein [Marinifilaceae bacterium]